MTMTGEPRRLEKLTSRESMRLLGTVPLGRVAFGAVVAYQADMITGFRLVPHY
jgi:hypothetical protein